MRLQFLFSRPGCRTHLNNHLSCNKVIKTLYLGEGTSRVKEQLHLQYYFIVSESCTSAGIHQLI